MVATPAAINVICHAVLRASALRCIWGIKSATGHKRSRNCHTIHEVMKTIADEYHHAGASADVLVQARIAVFVLMAP